MLEKYFCFDVYEDNEQEEASDTLIHTFIKEPWPHCETRYFYFQGEIAGVASKSTSPIFKKHRVELTLIIEHDPAATGLYGLFTNLWYGNTFKPPYDFKLTKIEVRYNRMAPLPCANGILRLYDTPSVGDVLPTLIRTSTRSLPELPWTPDSIFVAFDFDQPLLLKDHIYLFLSQGCSPYYTEPFHMTPKADEEGYCPGCRRWHYFTAGDPPHLNYYEDESQPHKIWGIPT